MRNLRNKLATICLLLPALCFAEAQFVEANQMDNPKGPVCKVLVNDYRPGSGVEYLGPCGWTGLKGVSAYVQGWNYSNHVRVVRGQFESGRPVAMTKVMYINRLNRRVSTFYEDGYSRTNVKVYDLDEVLSEAEQAGVKINGSIMTYVNIANYIDIFE